MSAPEDVAVDRAAGLERPVWIEDREGTIVRGVALSFSKEGLHAQLAALPGFAEGAAVALRLCLEPGAETVAATARVSWVRGENGHVDCGLAWIQAEGPLGEWLASSR